MMISRNHWLCVYKNNLLPRLVVSLILYIIPTNLIYIWISQIYHVKALSLYLENYWDHSFRKSKGEEQTLSDTHSFYLVS